jgi:hypothetical protein
MSKVTFCSFDKVRDQVVTPFQLHIDLGVSVLVSIAQRNQRVVAADNENNEKDGDQADEAAREQEHKISFPDSWRPIRRATNVGLQPPYFRRAI